VAPVRNGNWVGDAGEEMFNSKRQDLILQIIKGSDLTPVENCPGRYAAKTTIYLTIGEQQITIRPTDLLDLVNSECLVVHGDDFAHNIPWDQISKLDFEGTDVTTTFEPPPSTTAAHRMLHFPLGKKSY
jgi:hypothetical protein